MVWEEIVPVKAITNQVKALTQGVERGTDGEEGEATHTQPPAHILNCLLGFKSYLI